VEVVASLSQGRTAAAQCGLFNTNQSPSYLNHLVSKIFLQHFERTHLPSLAHKHKLVGYVHYVDDVLLIYDDLQTDIHTILYDFNSLHPNLQFIKETELDNKLNYLDITNHKTPTSVNMGVFR